jgi:hypothetical protein
VCAWRGRYCSGGDRSADVAGVSQRDSGLSHGLKIAVVAMCTITTVDQERRAIGGSGALAAQRAHVTPLVGVCPQPL